MKKILHIGQLIGGLDGYIRNTVIYSSDNFEYVIIHGENDNSQPILKHGNLVKEYKVPLQRELSILKDISCLLRVICIIRKEKPDLIHCHSAKGGTIGRIAGGLTRTTTCYTPHAFSYLSTSSVLRKNIYRQIERRTHFNSYVLACSESEREIAINEIKYNQDHAFVWHNAVPDTSLEKGHEPSIGNDFACYIGRPCYQKNVLFLLDVINKVKNKGCDLQFILLGVGYHSPDLQKVKERIEELNLVSNVKIIPWINHHDCQEYVKRSLFYVSTSLYEGLPLAIIEAMAQGKAVIASDVIGNRDCVLNGETGYLLPFDVNVFADHICLLVENESLRQKMEVRARKEFLDKFLIDKQIKELEDEYRKLININRGGVNLRIIIVDVPMSWEERRLGA